MRVAAARAHFRRDPDRLRQLFVQGLRAKRRSGVSFDAVRTLGDDVGDGNSDDLLDLGRKRALGEDRLTEGLKGGRGFRCQRRTRAGQLLRDWIEFVRRFLLELQFGDRPSRVCLRRTASLWASSRAEQTRVIGPCRARRRNSASSSGWPRVSAT